MRHKNCERPLSKIHETVEDLDSCSSAGRAKNVARLAGRKRLSTKVIIDDRDEFEVLSPAKVETSSKRKRQQFIIFTPSSEGRAQSYGSDHDDKIPDINKARTSMPDQGPCSEHSDQQYLDDHKDAATTLLNLRSETRSECKTKISSASKETAIGSTSARKKEPAGKHGDVESLLDALFPIT